MNKFMEIKKYLTKQEISQIISRVAQKYMGKENYVNDQNGNRTNYIISVARKFEEPRSPMDPEEPVNINSVYIKFNVRKDIDCPFEIPKIFEGVKTIISQISLEEKAKGERELNKCFSDNPCPL